MKRRIALLIMVLSTLALGAWLTTKLAMIEVTSTEGRPSSSSTDSPIVREVTLEAGDEPEFGDDSSIPTLEQSPEREAVSVGPVQHLKRSEYEIFGRVTALDGSPSDSNERELNDVPLENEWIGRPKIQLRVAHGGKTLRMRAAESDGSFVLPKLGKGRLNLTVEARGYEPAETVVELDDTHPKRKVEFALRPLERVRVEVHVRGAQGVRGRDGELHEDKLAKRLQLDATLVFSTAPPDRDAAASFSDPSLVLRRVRMERHSVRGGDWVFPAAFIASKDEVASGRFVGLQVGDAPVETQRVELPVRTVVIALDAEKFLASHAGVSLRVVDRSTSRPVEDARVELLRPGFPSRLIGYFEARGMGAGARTDSKGEDVDFDRGATDAEGRLSLEVARLGRVLLVIEAPPLERIERELELRPDFVEDLGTLELGEEIVVRGQLLDTSGPQPYDFIEVVPIGSGLARRVQADELGGGFVVHGLSRRRYFFRRVHPMRSVLEPIELDLSAGGVHEVELRQSRGTRVNVRIKAPKLLKEIEVLAFDERGRELARVFSATDKACDHYLLPGEYLLVVRARGIELAARKVTVGTMDLTESIELQ